MGQIASFMDALGMSYEEVVNKRPYRNLVIMQKDRLRVCYGEKMVEVTPDEMFRGRKVERIKKPD